MNRLSFAFAASLTLAACGAKENGSVCNEVPPPAACMTQCDPSPGAANSCPSGFHCSPDGKCDAQCTPGGNQCGDGYVCTSDGSCVDDGSGSGSNNGPDASCPAINFTPMPVTPSILLVLDQSGSMAGTDINPTRYDAMRNALVDPTTGVVSNLETKAYFGSKLYTCNGNNNAFVDTPRALNNAAAIRTSLDTHRPSDSTPTAAALDKAKTDFTTSPPPSGSPPVIVLATDGEPNGCGTNMSQAQYNAQSVAAAAGAYAAGVPVYVLAIATGNNTHFQDLANAGQGWHQGDPNVKYYPVSNATQLQQAFQTIINGVISCDLKLTSSIDDNSASSGVITVNGMTLTYGVDWVLVNGNIVRLQGQACTNLKSAMNPVVQATFPCGSVIF